jgi:YVTN family beta-propeller protein
MPELPSGAVTFLFTDVEGSTQLVKQLRDRYEEVLGEHQRLLREAFEQHRGHEIDTQGDAFFVAFASARDAVLAALAGQRALSRYPWPDETAVKVRIGIHTGQAAPVNGRYTGLAVHRAARICAAGHGGQVLVSQATQTLLEDEEEDLEVQLRDLGDQRLKDLDRPVHLYQVAAPGLPEQFPPLRKEAAPPAAEPIPLYRRRRVLALAAAALAVIAGLAVFLLTRSSGAGGLGSVHVNNVGVIDAKSGAIVAEVQTGIRPGPVAAGPGAVWIGNLEDRDLTRVDPKTRAEVRRIPLNNRTPTGIAVDPRAGAVWVAHGLLGSVSRVDPQYNTVSTPVAAAGRSGSGSVTVGGGSVWAVFGNSTLVRINPSSTRISGRGFAGSGPNGIVYAEGSVWVANGGDATVYRFNPATFESGPVVTTSVGRQPSAIAYGEGSIWVTNAGDDSVTRIDPSSNSTRGLIPVGRGPSSIAVGAGGVWVANSGDGTVSRIDPKTNTVAKTIHTGNVPAGIAVSGGFVWVTVQAP